MREIITSVQNPKIKELLALQEKSRLRRKEGLFVLEGRRELERCVAAGMKVRTVFVCPEILSDSTIAQECVFEVSAAVYARIAYREGTEGVMAIVETPELGLERLNLPEKPLVVVLEAVEKPGNLGAVLRSADAAGADAVIVCDELADVFNPNVIRASTGAVFSVPVAVASSEEAIDFLKKNNIRILTAQLQDSVLYYDSPMTGGTAIVMGTEDKGLSDIWREAADEHIRIPMLGVADSLNVSVSAAILLFEAVRQRRGDARSGRACRTRVGHDGEEGTERKI